MQIEVLYDDDGDRTTIPACWAIACDERDVLHEIRGDANGAGPAEEGTGGGVMVTQGTLARCTHAQHLF